MEVNASVGGIVVVTAVVVVVEVVVEVVVMVVVRGAGCGDENESLAVLVGMTMRSQWW